MQENKKKIRVYHIYTNAHFKTKLIVVCNSLAVVLPAELNFLLFLLKKNSELKFDGSSCCLCKKIKYNVIIRICISNSNRLFLFLANQI